jgi:hypothetical protein
MARKKYGKSAERVVGWGGGKLGKTTGKKK